MSPDVPAAAQQERVAALRAAVRRAVAAGDRTAARRLRAELRAAERDGERHRSQRGAPDVREQAHRALELLGVPAGPKLVGAVHAAFFAAPIPAARIGVLRRAEERSFRAAPDARPFYVCAALTADLLTPARGLLAVSTWPLERRVVGPLSRRTDFLTAAVRVAEHAGRSVAAQRLLRRFAAAIPGAAGAAVGTVDPADLIAAARAELEVHAADDRRDRERAARRAADLDAAERLFGSAHDRTGRPHGERR
ncbi:hypothetical protein [Actinomadura rubteroloni]|nr:hypothetical protein [Actinomadura rubteroloni]